MSQPVRLYHSTPYSTGILIEGLRPFDAETSVYREYLEHQDKKIRGMAGHYGIMPSVFATSSELLSFVYPFKTKGLRDQRAAVCKIGEIDGIPGAGYLIVGSVRAFIDELSRSAPTRFQILDRRHFVRVYRPNGDPTNEWRSPRGVPTVHLIAETIDIKRLPIPVEFFDLNGGRILLMVNFIKPPG